MVTEVRIGETALESSMTLDAPTRDRITRKLEEIVDWDREDDVLYVVEVLERKHDYRELSSLREVWGTWRD